MVCSRTASGCVSTTFNKRFPPVFPAERHETARNTGSGRVRSRGQCGEKCTRARHRARTLVTSTSSFVWEKPQAQIAETVDTFAGLRRTLRASSPSGRLDSRLYQSRQRCASKRTRIHVLYGLCVYTVEYVDSNCRSRHEGKGVLGATPLPRPAASPFQSRTQPLQPGN